MALAAIARRICCRRIISIIACMHAMSKNTLFLLYLVSLAVLLSIYSVCHLNSLDTLASSRKPNGKGSVASSSSGQTQLKDAAAVDLAKSDSLLRPILLPNCSMSGAGDPEQTLRMKQLLSDSQIQQRFSNCDDYFRRIPVEAIRMKDREDEAIDKDFQFAFSHQVHKDIGTLEMFMAVIFRPQNIHCIHVDQKAPKRVHQSVQSLVRCYNQRFGENTMFIIRNPISVFWGHISVLDADLICLHELMERHARWQYFVNTAGTEMPIVPYPKFVEMAKRAEGDNILESYKLPHYFNTRINRYYHLERYGPRKYDLHVVRTNFTKPPPPFHLTVYKGLKNVLITRNFSDFILNHPVAIEFYKWLEDIRVPDENFYQTLSRIKDIRPNMIIQDHEMNTVKAGYPRYTLWAFERKKCHGKWIRLICNFALQDLPYVRQQNALVANKFNMAVDLRAPVCQWKYLRDLSDGTLQAEEEEKAKNPPQVNEGSNKL